MANIHQRTETCRGRRTGSGDIEARYVNYFEIGHNAFEFMVDFGQFYPGSETVRMHSRIVTGPAYAKLLAQVLIASVQRFEQEHGPIQPADDDIDPLAMVRESLDGFDSRPIELRNRSGTSRAEPQERE